MALTPATYNVTTFGVTPPLIRILHPFPVNPQFQSTMFSNVLPIGIESLPNTAFEVSNNDSLTSVRRQSLRSLDSIQEKDFIQVKRLDHKSKSKNFSSTITKRSKNSKALFFSQTNENVHSNFSSQLNKHGHKLSSNSIYELPMDTRIPEHADPFESNKMQGDLKMYKQSGVDGGFYRKNGSLSSVLRPSSVAMAQMPILWTALSLALGMEVRGEIIRGLPCIKRLNQLFCRNAGTSYPSDSIESFIDNNKALTRRMYGDFQSELGPGEIVESVIRGFRGKREAETTTMANFAFSNVTEWDELVDEVHGSRSKRQANRRPTPVPQPPPQTISSGRKDSCKSKMEIVTPYWASNSAGKILAIVNLNEFSQVIHQEVCTRTSTKRCNGDCGCEQKYKWHRLLAYDLENECKGIFVDWFLFPSCCVCRCDP